MRSVFYAALAIVPWVFFTVLLRYLIAIRQCPVSLVGTLSRLITIAILAAWVLSTGHGWRRLRPGDKRSWLLLMGAVAIGINLLWFGALKWTSATNVSMFFRLDVLFVVVIGWALGLERIGRPQLLLIPIMLFGLALVTELDRFEWGGHVIGDFMIIGAAFGLAVNAFVIRHILQSMDDETVALYNHCMNMLGFVVLGWWEHDFSAWPEIVAVGPIWQTLVLLGVLAAIGLPLYYVALRNMSIWKLRMYMLSAPVLTALVEWPLWGTQLTPLQVLGAAIVLAGLAALIWLEWRQTGGSIENR
ncbi:MAG: DMT family transporter [Planctomycetes bacterium]|nr:DMT family transporter [Planctomycetota bacterium]